MSTIILSSGFLPIKAHTSSEKATNLIKSGHVVSVKEEQWCNVIFIKGRVIRQTKVNEAPVCVEIETRHIVVRDVDGTLRKATWREREMCNEIYFPVKGRKLRIPKMFIPEYFEGFPLTQVTGSTLVKEVLNKGWFQFILERACIQFEPDDPFYISVTQRTFDKIAEGKGFQEFESSRFFGPMIYYFTEKQKLAPVIVYFLNYNRMEDILALIKLHNILQPDRVCSVPNQPGRELTLLRAFVAEQYPHDSQLELALKSYEDYISKPKAQAAI